MKQDNGNSIAHRLSSIEEPWSRTRDPAEDWEGNHFRPTSRSHRGWEQPRVGSAAAPIARHPPVRRSGYARGPKQDLHRDAVSYGSRKLQHASLPTGSTTGLELHHGDAAGGNHASLFRRALQSRGLPSTGSDHSRRRQIDRRTVP